MQAHDTAVRSIKWSHNDQWMISADHDGYIKYWQANMNNVTMFQAHKEAVRSVRWATIRIRPFSVEWALLSEHLDLVIFIVLLLLIPSKSPSRFGFGKENFTLAVIFCFNGSTRRFVSKLTICSGRYLDVCIAHVCLPIKSPLSFSQSRIRSYRPRAGSSRLAARLDLIP